MSDSYILAFPGFDIVYKCIRRYGSGYPGYSGRSVEGRNLPFYFWPIVWRRPSGTAFRAGTSGARVYEPADEASEKFDHGIKYILKLESVCLN